MPNKSIYKIRIKDDIDKRTWYSGLNGSIFYAVKTVLHKNIYWQIVNNEHFNGSYIWTGHVDILELITRVILPYN